MRYLNNSIPSPALYEPNNMVCPYWDDIWLNGSVGGSGDMYYEFTTLSNGNNWVSVEWRQVELRGAGDSGLVSFSVAFCNSTNCYRPNAIIFVYADVDAANASYSYGIGASVGLENSTGTIGEQFSHNQALLYNGLKIVWTPFVPIYGFTTDPVGGYEDNLPDAMLFRPSNGYWYHFHSYLDTTNWFQFGTNGDVALPGDYDGDGDTDHCVFRPSYNTWFGNSPTFTKEWGYAGDIPVPADYDGDGSLDIAVWRPSSGHWFVYYRGTGSSTVYQWGTAGDIPVPADYDNDNIADYAVWRPSNGVWFIRKSSDGTSWVIPYGTDGDIPMPGNFSSSFYSTMTIFRPSNGYWFYYNQSTGAAACSSTARTATCRFRETRMRAASPTPRCTGRPPLPTGLCVMPLNYRPFFNMGRWGTSRATAARSWLCRRRRTTGDPKATIN